MVQTDRVSVTYCTAPCGMGSSPINAGKCMWMKKRSTAMLIKKSVGVTPEVNLRKQLTMYTSDKEQKQGIYPDFETHGRRHKERGVRVAPKRPCFLQILKRKSSDNTFNTASLPHLEQLISHLFLLQPLTRVSNNPFSFLTWKNSFNIISTLFPLNSLTLYS